MTTITTDPDYRALLRNVLHAPNDDLPRLVLADWLEEPERAGTVPCPRTSGTLCPFYLSRPCPTCNGTGYVSNGNAERAEFIRLQCEIARLEKADCPHKNHDIEELKARLYELRGSGGPGEIASNLWEWFYKHTRGSLEILHLERGFVGSIRLTAEKFERHAAALFREHPITEVVLSGKQPWKTRYGHSWWSETNPYGQDDIVTKVIFDLLDEYEDHDGTYKRYPTREAALAALSDACVRYGRNLAGLREEYAQ